jgi:ligand-binding sensor domain-containing protein
MKSLSVYLLAIFFITLNLRGQNVHFKNLNRQDGLSDNFVRVIYEDNYGYMWFGTTNGLNRFDGVEMKQFKRIVGDESSLAEANINDILQTSSNKLLVGYNSGLDVYNYKREDFAKIEELKGVVVSKIVEDDVGNIWIVTGNNLMLKFDKNLSQVKDFSFSTIIKNKFNISTSSLNVYKYDDDNLLFIF